LKIATVPIESLRPDDKNARLHPVRNLQAISESLKRFGQQRPIIVDAAGVIRAGNGTWAAAKALGWKSIAVVVSELEGDELRAFALADNQTALLSEWDMPELLRQLGEVGEVESVGFSDAEVHELIERLSVFDAEGDEAEADPRKPLIKTGGVISLLVKMRDVGIVEAAIKKTGKGNRAEAVVEIFRSYLEKGQFDIH
jgi:ParB-like chromosome segregation protein Spo0J